MGQLGVSEPEHQVSLSRGFIVSSDEITNEEYRSVVQWAFDNGLVVATSSTVRAYGQELLDLDDPDCEISFFDGAFSLKPVFQGDYAGESSAHHPVKEVSWFGAACFCDWLSTIVGLDPFYQGVWDQIEEHNPYASSAFRLLTEAEWEYAAQYNDERFYPWGNSTPDSDHANYNSYVGWTSPIGSYPLGASELELMDMAGNVYEWVGDWLGSYETDPQIDPLGANSGTSRILRGGSWNGGPAGLRCAFRNSNSPSTSGGSIGFRICRTLSQNLPPPLPACISPEDGEVGVLLSPTLIWSCDDPDGDALAYDVYLGTTLNLTVDDLVSSAQLESEFVVFQALELGSEYFWKVVADDGFGHEVEGPVWSFVTITSISSYFVADYSFPGIPCFPGTSFGWDFNAWGGNGLAVVDVHAADIGGMMQYEVRFSGLGEIHIQLDNCSQGTEGAAFIAVDVPDDGFGHYYPEGVTTPVSSFCDYCLMIGNGSTTSTIRKSPRSP